MFARVVTQVDRQYYRSPVAGGVDPGLGKNSRKNRYNPRIEPSNFRTKTEALGHFAAQSAYEAGKYLTGAYYDAYVYEYGEEPPGYQEEMVSTYTRKLKKRPAKKYVRKPAARATKVAVARNMVTTYLEKKFLDTTSTTTAFPTGWVRLNPTAGSVGCLSMPATGDTESSRDGRTYMIHSIFVRMTITMAAVETATAPINSTSYRVCLVHDQQTNGTAIVATEVMDAGASRDEDSFRNLQNTRRFRVLSDTGHQVINVFQVADGATADRFSNATQQRVVKFNHEFKEPIKVRCTGTGADVQFCSDNSLALIGIANQTTVSYTFETRIRFISA